MTIRKILTALALLVMITGCTKDLEVENRAPVLERVLTDISIGVNGTAQITLKHIKAYDNDGDIMSVIAHAGENYTSSGNMVTPASGFIGDLRVPVQVSDGELLSEMDTITVSVVNEIAVVPLFNGAWWEYDDSVYGQTGVITSRLDVKDSSTRLIQGIEISAYEVEWSHLNEKKVSYLMSSDVNGTTIHGGFSSSDTLISPQKLATYPAVLNESWSYTPFKYNVTDSSFIRTVAPQTMTCTNTSIYVTVPAGIFECVELTYSYPMELSRSGATMDLYNGLGSLPGVESRASVMITEKLYYAEGVGNVQNITLQGDVVVWKKVLTDYSVIELIN